MQSVNMSVGVGSTKHPLVTDDHLLTDTTDRSSSSNFLGKFIVDDYMDFLYDLFGNVTTVNDDIELPVSNKEKVNLDTPMWFLLVNFTNFMYYATPILAIISFLGNTTVLLVVLQKKNRTFSTSVYIASLAAADLLVNCGVDFQNWLVINGFILDGYSHLDCRLRTLIPITGTFASVWSLCAVAIERAISVLLPHKVKYICTWSSAKTTVALVWLISFMFSAYNSFVLYFFKEVVHGAVISKCIVKEEFAYFNRRYFSNIYIFVTFLGPLLLILTSTILIASVLITKRVSKISGKNLRTPVTITLLKVNILFLITFTPHSVYALLSSISFFGDSIRFDFESYKRYLQGVTLQNISLFLISLNSTMHVFVYFFSSSKFRADFANLFRLSRARSRAKSSTKITVATDKENSKKSDDTLL